MLPIVVSQRVTHFPDRREIRDELDQTIAKFLFACQCLAFPIPNSLTPEARIHWLKRLKPKGVVFSGGGDVGIDFERDDTEKFLLRYARQEHLPILGICRGMQFLTLEAGGELVDFEGHVSARHTVKFSSGDSREVNSFHNQCILSCAPGFEVYAECLMDGTIEAVKHKTESIFAMMWHPERENPFDLKDIELVSKLFLGTYQ